jgi:hypothetical protein
MRTVSRFLTVAPVPEGIQLTGDLKPLVTLPGAYLQKGDNEIVFETRMGCQSHAIYLGEIPDMGDYVPEVVKHAGSYVLIFRSTK